MQQACKQCSAPFEVTDGDLAFFDQVSPVIAGKKHAIPPPTFCPECRQQRRLAQCNERTLYPGVCDLCTKKVVTEHPPHSGQTIYCRECWNSDRWDPCDYGKDFDFSRPFFQQLYELRRSTPAIALNQTGTVENSDYIHYAGFSKNCYLIMHADYCEDCCYGYGFKKNRSCMDGFYNLHCELCYDCVYVHKSYGIIGCQDCVNCSSSAFLKDCIGCRHCFLGTGLRNKEYVFGNEQLTKQEYEARLQATDLRSSAHYQDCRSRLQTLTNRSIVREYEGNNIEYSSGNYLQNCKNCRHCFDMEDGEDCAYCYQLVLGAKNSHDIYQYGTVINECYECSIVGDGSYHILFSSEVFINCSDLLYCYFLEGGCRDCFGCVSMKGGSYRILNKQYTKEEYEELVPRIIEHMCKDGGGAMNRASGASSGSWGEYMPASISLFGYNTTTAQLYYPLTKEEVLARGWKWEDYEPPPLEVEKIIDAASLPDSITAVPDDILQWAIRCEATGKLFKIQPLELKLYRQMGVPIPRRCPEQRHLERFAKRNPRKFFDRACAKCKKAIRTTYAPERLEIVYCEECYLKEVY